MTTAQRLPAHTVEQIWYAASVLDNDPEHVLEAVVVGELTGPVASMGVPYLCCGEYGSITGARRGAKHHAKKDYFSRTFIVTRGRGEGFVIA